MTPVARRLVLLLGLAGFIVIADNWVVSPILPAISKGVGVQSASAGILIASCLGAILAAVLASSANALVFAGGSSLLVTAFGVFLLGFGFMTAHSTLITVATEFASRARGTAMSLVTLAFMVGGAVGTQLGGRIAEAASFNTMYAAYGAGLLVLAMLSWPALAGADVKPAKATVQPA